jgi:hypothetical protein
LRTYEYDAAYAALGVPVGADFFEVKRAWRYLVKYHHPDVFTDLARREQATEALKKYNAAFDLLRKYWHSHGTMPRCGTSGTADSGTHDREPDRTAADECQNRYGPNAAADRSSRKQGSGHTRSHDNARYENHARNSADPSSRNENHGRGNADQSSRNENHGRSNADQSSRDDHGRRNTDQRSRDENHGRRNTDQSSRNENHGRSNADQCSRNENHGRGNADQSSRNENHGRSNADRSSRNENHGRGNADQSSRNENPYRNGAENARTANPSRNGPDGLDEFTNVAEAVMQLCRNVWTVFLFVVRAASNGMHRAALARPRMAQRARRYLVALIRRIDELGNDCRWRGLSVAALLMAGAIILTVGIAIPAAVFAFFGVDRATSSAHPAGACVYLWAIIATAVVLQTALRRAMQKVPRR